MDMLTTNEIKVSARSTFQPQYSHPEDKQYVFSYRVLIENNSSHSIQLMARRWQVIDATGMRRTVEGAGVVGQQPVIPPGQSYEYNSWVQFGTSLGAMEGNYIMARKDSRGRDRFFEVRVPRFAHVAPEVLN